MYFLILINFNSQKCSVTSVSIQKRDDSIPGNEWNPMTINISNSNQRSIRNLSNEAEVIRKEKQPDPNPGKLGKEDQKER